MPGPRSAKPRTPTNPSSRVPLPFDGLHYEAVRATDCSQPHPQRVGKGPVTPTPHEGAVPSMLLMRCEAMRLSHCPTTPVLAQPVDCRRLAVKARSRSRSKPRTPRELEIPDEHGLPDTARLLGRETTTDSTTKQHGLAGTAESTASPTDILADFPMDMLADLPPPEKKPGKIVEVPVIWQRSPRTSSSPRKSKVHPPDLSSVDHGVAIQHPKDMQPRTPTKADPTDAPRLHVPTVVRDILSSRNRDLEAPRGFPKPDWNKLCGGSENEDDKDAREKCDMQAEHMCFWSLGDEVMQESNAPATRSVEDKLWSNQCLEQIDFVRERVAANAPCLESDLLIHSSADVTAEAVGTSSVLTLEHFTCHSPSSLSGRIIKLPIKPMCDREVTGISDLSTDSSQQIQRSQRLEDRSSAITLRIPAEAYPANVANLVRSAVSYKNASIVVESGAARPKPVGMNSLRSQRLIVDAPQMPCLERTNSNPSSLASSSVISGSSRATIGTSSTSAFRSNSSKVSDAVAKRCDRDGKMLYLYAGVASCCIVMLIGVTLAVAFATVPAMKEERRLLTTGSTSYWATAPDFIDAHTGPRMLQSLPSNRMMTLATCSFAVLVLLFWFGYCSAESTWQLLVTNHKFDDCGGLTSGPYHKSFDFEDGSSSMTNVNQYGVLNCLESTCPVSHKSHSHDDFCVV